MKLVFLKRVLKQCHKMDEQKKDSLNVLGSVREFPEQCEEAWREVGELQFPEEYQKIENIVICGMGGSLLGGRVVKAIGEINLPLELWSDYGIPAFVNEKTLMIVCSYSGNTEETLSSASAGIEKKAKMVALCNGGRLEVIAKENGWPVYVFNPEHNPAGQPRLAVGYSLMAILGIAAKLGLSSFFDKEAQGVVDWLKNVGKSWGDEASSNNTAREAAQFLHGKIGVLISAGYLEGVTLAMRNMFHENSKQLVVNFELPELNHHLLEGLSYPEKIKETVGVIFFESELYLDVIKKRFDLTREVFSKNEIPVWAVQFSGRTVYEQVFESLQWGLYVAYYLANLNKVDPGPIPFVEWFKKEL